MSKYHRNPNAKFMYEAAERWRDTCLLQDGSVFSDKELWSKKNLSDDIESRFVGFIDPTNDPKYEGKSNLEQWMTYLEDINSGPEIYQLMAEALWVMYLPIAGIIKADKKKKNIRLFWDVSKEELPDEKLSVYEGIVNPGAGFNINMWFELFVFILHAHEIKSLSVDERKRFLENTDIKEVSRQLDEWPEKWYKQWPELWERHFKANKSPLKVENCQIRHTLLHLLFPDNFERVFSGGQKRRIVKAFKGEEASEKSWPEIDETLRVIRAEQEKIHGPEIDFNSEPLRSIWKNSKKIERKKPNTPNTPSSSTMSNIPLNLIFYGPPGTGKTYRTINAALEILDPDFYKGNKKENEEQRKKLRERYEQLKKEGQIEFVTFHQSFEYEEFVEGIRPLMGGDEGEQVAYEIRDGVFKRLCDQAKSTKPSLQFNEAIEDLKQKCSEDSVDMKTVTGINIKVWYFGNTTFRIEKNDRFYPASIAHIKKVYQGADYKEFYNPSYIRAIINHIKEKYDISEEISTDAPNSCVLIIDEINRGNISRIFGELITLIEKSKRLGETEATTATLPYSGESFGVPNNLYIIGTMNTADRSIALLDTALRRRFRFEEMMPKYEPLNGINVGEVNIGKLLKTMNERIEALYDRDHQIGHSYFLPLKDSPDVETLKDIFLHEILPLLQEYFYDDWEKIHTILNSNEFLQSNSSSKKMKNRDFIDPDKKLWRINPDSKVFDQISNYQKIYQDTDDAEADNSS